MVGSERMVEGKFFSHSVGSGWVRPHSRGKVLQSQGRV